MQQANWVGFVDAVSVALRFDVEFIEFAAGHARDKTFPNARGTTRAKTMRLGIPAIKAAYDGNGTRVGRPHAEDGAGYAIVRDEMGSHLVVHAIVAALVEEVKILLGEELNGVGYGGIGRVGHARRLVYRKDCISMQDVAWDVIVEAVVDGIIFSNLNLNHLPCNQVPHPVANDATRMGHPGYVHCR